MHNCFNIHVKEIWYNVMHRWGPQTIIFRTFYVFMLNFYGFVASKHEAIQCRCPH